MQQRPKAKRILLYLLAALLLLCALPVAGFAQSEDAHLKFDDNGDFTILHLTDWHCDYPLPALHKQLVLESLAEAKPDLVVLGGDLSEAANEDQPAAIKEICEIFVQAEIPFVITFGNHDYMHGYTIDEMFSFYQKFGGAYFIGTDEQPDLFGCGTCSIPVYAHDGSRVAYNIYCFDSGDSVAGKGYDSVHADQIEWYREKAEELKDANGGEFVPAVVFQHIIVQEIYDKLFPAAQKYSVGVREYDTQNYDLLPIPNLSNIKDGYIFEKPCPGYYNHGQLDAMSKNGDVRAIFCGHDHYNSFTVEIDGVDIVNTPSVKPHIFLRKINWGSRVITLHEDGSYESRVLTALELADREGSAITATGDVSRFEFFLVKIWKAFADVSMFLWKAVTGFTFRF
ncbi:MAG: metallophosphoesterase [Clostridia bacterium]|nr:metallophosphoesterase [Clostridia bacterium]